MGNPRELLGNSENIFATKYSSYGRQIMFSLDLFLCLMSDQSGAVYEALWVYDEFLLV